MKSGIIKKYILISAGSLSLVFGVFGVFIPVLPTTPFLLLAAFCYLRSSQTLYSWLMYHRIFGKYISNYMLHKAVKKNVKIGAIVFLWCSLGFSIVIIDSLHVRILLGVIGIAVSIHILKLRTLKNEKTGGSVMLRTTKKSVTGSTQYDGAGVKLVRVLGNATVEDFDPFLMLDAFDSTDPADYIKGFPWHPHRGIETVTYLIRGDIEHGDSIGNTGRILDGCCQWMTAGSGIMHQEMPQPADRMLGVQLWLNLPASDKMTKPQYRDITADQIPKISEGGSLVGVISGTYKDTSGPVQGDYVKMLFLDVNLQPDTEWRLETQPDDTLFIYIVDGEGSFDEAQQNIFTNKRAVLFHSGDTFRAKASHKGIRFLLFSAKALKEPVAWGGPIVMNTKQELDQAFREIKSGTFIKPGM